MHFLGVEVGWCHKVMVKFSINTENSQTASIGVIFSWCSYHTKQLNPWTTLCSELYPAACLLIQGRWNHLKTTRALMYLCQTSETALNKAAWVLSTLILAWIVSKCVQQLLLCSWVISSGHLFVETLLIENITSRLYQFLLHKAVY